MSHPNGIVVTLLSAMVPMKQRTDAPSTELTLNRDNPAVNKALVELVRLLARRAARKWYHQQVEAHLRDREASQTLNAEAALVSIGSVMGPRIGVQ